METRETPLQMAERHLREGDERIARQEALVVELELRERTAQLPLALELLAHMREFKALTRLHLKYELTKAGNESGRGAHHPDGG